MRMKTRLTSSPPLRAATLVVVHVLTKPYCRLLVCPKGKADAIRSGVPLSKGPNVHSKATRHTVYLVVVYR